LPIWFTGGNFCFDGVSVLSTSDFGHEPRGAI
jgi:hypothetical protein